MRTGVWKNLFIFLVLAFGCLRFGNTNPRFVEDAKKENIYARLGLTSTATEEEIKKAFRERSIFFQPKTIDEQAKNPYFLLNARLNEAYDILKNKNKKQAYDKSGRTNFVRDHYSVDQDVDVLFAKYVRQFLRKNTPYAQLSLQEQLELCARSIDEIPVWHLWGPSEPEGIALVKFATEKLLAHQPLPADVQDILVGKLALSKAYRNPLNTSVWQAQGAVDVLSKLETIDPMTEQKMLMFWNDSIADIYRKRTTPLHDDTATKLIGMIGRGKNVEAGTSALGIARLSPKAEQYLLSGLRAEEGSAQFENTLKVLSIKNSQIRRFDYPDLEGDEHHHRTLDSNAELMRILCDPKLSLSKTSKILMHLNPTPQQQALIIAQLDHSDPNVRLKMLGALASQGDSLRYKWHLYRHARTDLLSSYITDSSPQVRQAAYTLISHTRLSGRSENVFLDTLAHRNPAIAQDAQEAFAKHQVLGKVGTEKLFKRIANDWSPQQVERMGPILLARYRISDASFHERTLVDILAQDRDPASELAFKILELEQEKLGRRSYSLSSDSSNLKRLVHLASSSKPRSASRARDLLKKVPSIVWRFGKTKLLDSLLDQYMKADARDENFFHDLLLANLDDGPRQDDMAKRLLGSLENGPKGDREKALRLILGTTPRREYNYRVKDYVVFDVKPFVRILDHGKIVDLLRSRNPLAVASAKEILKSFGNIFLRPEATDKLVLMLRDGDKNLRATASEILSTVDLSTHVFKGSDGFENLQATIADHRGPIQQEALVVFHSQAERNPGYWRTAMPRANHVIEENGPRFFAVGYTGGSNCVLGVIRTAIPRGFVHGNN